ncbi:RagB/SusD family nutrient uptake outer membrane protein [Zhouia amylolytica]|uniref:RagB/SusD domain-containing protein n=1 Tax=Zhouia amylolytica AD3 TaxID=1286632 RepID=W2UMT0_9FLAO|nr:RagB/SusD family nutrient uptake outer membrane protein [Zhouia amylolytica]ETN95298.1 hypothetical protein P278_10200 [Zhouia amylolytica AD3]
MKVYKSMIAVFLLLSCIACNNDFLERAPSDQISTANFFKQTKDLEVALNAVYDEIGFNSWWVTYGSGTDMLRIEALTDNALDHHSWNAGYRLADGTAAPDDGYSSYRWKMRYVGIQRVNRIFEGVSGIENIDEEYKNRLLGEAAFLRAYFYFDLVYLFGDVPYLTTSVSPTEVQGTEEGPTTIAQRVDKDLILDDLVTQLNAVVNDLPVSYPDSDKGRVTRGAALFLKSKILLYQEKWNEAAAAAKAVMDLNAYQLFPKYETLFDYEGIGSSEVIFDIQVKQDVNQGEFYTQNYGPNSVGGWSSSCPLQSMVDAYECIDGLTIESSPLYDPNNPYENRDPRLRYSILYPGHEWRGGVYNTIPGATYDSSIVYGDQLGDGAPGEWNKTATGYNWLKYISNQDIDESDYWDGGVHFILMRYAEVLLVYAEAKIEAGSIDQSVYDAINEVRQRADVNMPPVMGGLSQSELRTIVRRERRVELAFEGQRLLDIRRWKIAEDVMPGVPEGLTYLDANDNEVTLNWGERIFDPNKHYLWPIPQNEIDISKIEQNPGW